MPLSDFADRKDDKEIKLIVLSQKANTKSGMFKTVERIVEEAKARGMKAYPVFVNEGTYISDTDVADPKVIIRNFRDTNKFISFLPENGVAIVRGSALATANGRALVQYLEEKGVFVINSSKAMTACNNKFNSAIKLSANGVKCPKTALISKTFQKEALDNAVNSIGGKFPIILKTLGGSYGVGISKVDNMESLRGVVQTIWKFNNSIIIQEYIEVDGDIRTIIIDGNILACMKRLKNDGDFRSNFSLGSDAEKKSGEKLKPYKMNPKEEALVLKAAKSTGCYYCGVDHMTDKNGEPYVIEVNTSPGSQGIEKASGKNIVGSLVDHIADKTNWWKTIKESKVTKPNFILEEGMTFNRFKDLMLQKES